MKLAFCVWGTCVINCRGQPLCSFKQIFFPYILVAIKAFTLLIEIADSTARWALRRKCFYYYWLLVCILTLICFTVCKTSVFEWQPSMTACDYLFLLLFFFHIYVRWFMHDSWLQTRSLWTSDYLVTDAHQRILLLEVDCQLCDIGESWIAFRVEKEI